MPARRPGVAVLDVVIVATTGASALLADCLRSLERHPARSVETNVAVVDNASADAVGAMVRRDFPWVRLTTLEDQAGFSAANNTILRDLVGDYVLLLNPDTEVTEGALDAALRSLSAHERTAVVGVRLVQRDGSFDHAAKRAFPTPVSALAHFSGLGRWRAAPEWMSRYRAPGLDEHGSGVVDAVNGAFMLVRRSAMDAVGLLDEGYRMYGEDLDWCYRFQRAGWEVRYEGGVTVVHVKGATSVVRRGRGRHRPPSVNLAFHRSMGRYYRKFHAGRNPALDVVVYLGLAAKLAVSLLRSAVARRTLR